MPLRVTFWRTLPRCNSTIQLTDTLIIYTTLTSGNRRLNRSGHRRRHGKSAEKNDFDRSLSVSDHRFHSSPIHRRTTVKSAMRRTTGFPLSSNRIMSFESNWPNTLQRDNTWACSMPSIRTCISVDELTPMVGRRLPSVRFTTER